MHDFPLADILKKARRHPLFTFMATTERVRFGRAQIERLLPHRGPMLLLDSIDGIDLALGTLQARRRIAANDRGFDGHFPGDPVYPGALALEIAGQAGVCLLDFVARNSTGIPVQQQPRGVRLMKVHQALLLAEIRPGDELLAMARVLVHDELTSIFAAQLWRAETVCAVAIAEVCFVER